MAPASTTATTSTATASGPSGSPAGTPASAPLASFGDPPRDTVTAYRTIHPNRPLLFTGAGVLVGTYAATAIVSATNGRDADRNLLIPVVGPWLNLADRRCDGCNNESLNTALLIGSGVLQGGGALLTVASFFIPEKIEAARIQAGPVKWNVVPASYGRGSMGLGAVGTF